MDIVQTMKTRTSLPGNPLDPITLSAVSLLLAGIALFACHMIPPLLALEVSARGSSSVTQESARAHQSDGAGESELGRRTDRRRVVSQTGPVRRFAYRRQVNRRSSIRGNQMNLGVPSSARLADGLRPGGCYFIGRRFPPHSAKQACRRTKGMLPHERARRYSAAGTCIGEGSRRQVLFRL